MNPSLFHCRPSDLVPIVLLGLFLAAGCGGSNSSVTWGEKGTWKGAIFHPRAVQKLPDQSWVVLDRTDRVQVFSPDGRFLRGWRTPETGRGNPRGLALDRDGNILVADTHYSRVLRYSSQGELLQTIGKPGTGPGEFSLVTDMVEDASGILTTIEYGDRVRVQRLDRDGNFLAAWGEIGTEPGQLRRPQGMCLSPQGEIVIADSVNHRIQIFDTGGHLVRSFGDAGMEPGNLSYPYDVACDRQGRMYVMEFGNYRLQVFSPQGESLLCTGKPGHGPGEFDEPWGITVLDSGEVLVADTRNHRVQNLGRLF